jgi:tetratricopeptide (TPR) repeat protein
MGSSLYHFGRGGKIAEPTCRATSFSAGSRNPHDVLDAGKRLAFFMVTRVFSSFYSRSLSQYHAEYPPGIRDRMNDTTMLQRLDAALVRQPKTVILLLIAAAVFTVWGCSISFSFVWDDDYYIVMNEALRTPAEWPRYFTDSLTQKVMAPYPYRALRTLHYGILTWPFGRPVPWVFHLTNLLWHTAVSYLVFWLALRLFERVFGREAGGGARAAAMFSALAFAVHPAAAEVVCWAKCLDDLMGTFFLLCSFVAAWDAWSEDGRVRWKAALGSLLFFALALWSKESVVGLIFLFLFPLAVFRNLPKLVFGAWFLAQCSVLVVFVLIRNAILQYVSLAEAPLSGTYAQTLLDMIPILLLYGKSMLGIPLFHPDYSFMCGGYAIGSAPVLGGAAVIGLGLIATWWGLRRAGKRIPLWFGLSWIALALIPVSNVVPMIQYFAERFVYLPLVGFVILAGYGVGCAAKKAPAIPFYLLALIVLWGAVSVDESFKWKSPLNLWRYAYLHAPVCSDRIAVNYAVTLYGAGARSEADAIIARHGDSIRRVPKGRWLMAQRMWDQGERDESLRNMVALEKEKELGDSPSFVINLGVFFAEQGDLEKARGYLESAVRRWPSQIDAWKNLGLCLNNLGHYHEAIQAFTRALDSDPNYVGAWRGLSAAAWAAQDWPAAEKAFARLARLEPQNPENAYWLEQTREKNNQTQPPGSGTDKGQERDRQPP